MKKTGITIFGIITILFLSVSISGCINNTYDDKNLTFQYPGSWTIEGEAITTQNGIGTITNRSIKEIASNPRIVRVVPATFEDVVLKLREGGMSGNYDQQNVTIAGVKGILYIPTSSGNGEPITLYFAKGDTLYIIDIATNNIDEDKSGLDMIIKTVQFK